MSGKDEGGTDGWHARLMAAANADPAFASAAVWLDTRLVLRLGARADYLKLYRGRVIDAMAYDPNTNMLGYDVLVTAPDAVWAEVLAGRLSFGRASATGLVSMDGSRVEIERSYKAVQILGSTLLPAVALAGGTP